MRELQPLKAKRLASDWKTEIADLHEWAPMEYEQDEDEPLLFMKQMITALAREALLDMRKAR